MEMDKSNVDYRAAAALTLEQLKDAESIVCAMGMGEDDARYYEVTAMVLQALATNYLAEVSKQKH